MMTVWILRLKTKRIEKCQTEMSIFSGENFIISMSFEAYQKSKSNAWFYLFSLFWRDFFRSFDFICLFLGDFSRFSCVLYTVCLSCNLQLADFYLFDFKLQFNLMHIHTNKQTKQNNHSNNTVHEWIHSVCFLDLSFVLSRLLSHRKICWLALARVVSWLYVMHTNKKIIHSNRHRHNTRIHTRSQSEKWHFYHTHTICDSLYLFYFRLVSG